MGKSINDLIMEYFKKHQKQDLQHGPVVDWVEERYKKLYRKKPRDTWRQIRKLHQAGKKYFIKIYKQAVKINDEKMIKFCKSVFDTYNNYKINGHIPRPNGKRGDINA